MINSKFSKSERRSDTRSKIMMGGLIKKAGLDYLHPDQTDVIYGMLHDCKSQIDKSPSLIEKW